MAWMSVKDPLVHNSAEAEALACRRAVEFSIEAGFSRLVIEGDNTLFPELSWEGSSGNNQLVGTGMMMAPKIHGMDNIQHEDNSKNHGISVATQQIEAEKKGTEDVDTRNYHGLRGGNSKSIIKPVLEKQVDGLSGLNPTKSKSTWTRIIRMDYGLGGIRATNIPLLGKRPCTKADSLSKLQEEETIQTAKRGRVDGEKRKLMIHQRGWTTTLAGSNEALKLELLRA